MPNHWIVAVAQRAGLGGADSLAVDGAASIAEAWAAVTRASGVTPEALAHAVASQFGLRVAEAASAQLSAGRLVPEALARRHRVVPLRHDDRALVVATSDPMDVEVEQALGFASGRRPIFEVASPEAIEALLRAQYGADIATVDALLSRTDSELVDAVRVIEESEPEEVSASEVESAPIVKLTNLIFREATIARASDIHIEPGRGEGSIRFRVDGVLRPFMPLPLGALNRVVSRIKILGKLDIADRVRPQDGRTRIQVGDRTYDFRISTVPTRESEKAVIRILDPANALRLDDLSLPAGELRAIRRVLHAPNGIVVVTGPTGSGKTTLLYAALREIAARPVNIMTVEDPIEYELPGITQIQVDPRRGVTFASALRAILRQDPDVVFVGEIRDAETAEVAAHASQTGHLVLTTLHTNSAVGAVARLADLGLDAATIASTVRGVVAQRLLRRVCPRCAEDVCVDLTVDEVRLQEVYGIEPVVRAVGCARCAQTGYYGRIPVVEVAPITPTLEMLIDRGASEADLGRAAVADGMRSMLRCALDRVRAGETTLQEVERVLGEAGHAPTSADRPRILVVDDDAENRILARAVLERAGFAVAEAADGFGALERIGSGTPPSLVVLDLEMPRMGGRDVLARLRAEPSTARLPVVILTGAIEPEAEVRLMEDGADDYIRKPIEPRRFLARVKATLRRSGAIVTAAGD